MNKIGMFLNFWEKNWNADYIYYLNKIADLGFDILEFQAQPLLEMSKSKLDEIKKAAKDRNVEITYSLGLESKYDVSSPDASIRANGLEFLKKIVEIVAYMDGKIISGISYAAWGTPAGIINDKSAYVARSIENISKVAKTAADYDVTYCVEVVNRFEGIILNTAEEAVDYVKQIDNDHVKILLDTYHMNIEENSIGDAIRLAGPLLGSLHTGENNRTCPGRGHLNWDEIYQALSDIHYKNPIVSEPFVTMGGEVGRDIKVWRNLIQMPTEKALDEEARCLLEFEKKMLKKYGME